MNLFKWFQMIIWVGSTTNQICLVGFSWWITWKSKHGPYHHCIPLFIGAESPFFTMFKIRLKPLNFWRIRPPFFGRLFFLNSKMGQDEYTFHQPLNCVWRFPKICQCSALGRYRHTVNMTYISMRTLVRLPGGKTEKSIPGSELIWSGSVRFMTWKTHILQQILFATFHQLVAQQPH